MDRAIRLHESSPASAWSSPRKGPGGDGGVTRPASVVGLHLALAAASAAVYGDDLLIEEQLEGDNYRMLYLDRRAPGRVRPQASHRRRGRPFDRLPARATRQRGTGSGTASSSPKSSSRSTRICVDPAKQRLSLRSVPPEGTVVTLKTVVNEKLRGRQQPRRTDLLCDSIIGPARGPPTPSRCGLAGSTSSRATPPCPSRKRAGRSSKSTRHPAFIITTTSATARFRSPSTSSKNSWLDHPSLYRMGHPAGERPGLQGAQLVLRTVDPSTVPGRTRALRRAGGDPAARDHPRGRGQCPLGREEPRPPGGRGLRRSTRTWPSCATPAIADGSRSAATHRNPGPASWSARNPTGSEAPSCWPAPMMGSSSSQASR